MASRLLKGILFLGLSWSAAAVAQSARPGDQLLPAVYRCDVGAARAALDAGAAPNQVVKTFLGEQPILNAAVQHDCKEIAQLLLERGAGVEGETTGLLGADTPLMIAAGRGNVDIVKLLLAHHANVDAGSGSFLGQNALVNALKNHHPDIAELLIKNGANVDIRDAFQQTALMNATIDGDVTMVEFLLAHGADPNAKDLVNTTALMWAAKAGSVKLAQLLIDRGADVNASCKEYKYSNGRWPGGETSLMLAARFDRVQMVDLLLANGADRGRKNDDGQAAADLATTPAMKARVAP